VRDWPDFMDRIHAMGWSEEYLAYCERYGGRQQGKRQGKLSDGQSTRGFGYWYPTVEDWRWRRTLSYWIAVTFFQGSLFFTASSFLWCNLEELGSLKRVLTQGGYIAGRANVFVGCYLMCVQTINLTNATHSYANESLDAERGACSDSRTNSALAPALGLGAAPFHWWPFHYRTALRRLAALGAGPWPYVASIAYLTGVLIFGVGLLPDFLQMPGASGHWLGVLAFLLGSTLFLAGGLAECVENGILRRCACLNTGYVGAVLNTVGGVCFVVGAIIGFDPALSFYSMFAYGVGSFIYTIGSAAQITMWKDEQFGLTSLAVLNHLGRPTGRLERDGNSVADKKKAFSSRSACFIMVYALTSTLSVYDFLMLVGSESWRLSGLLFVNRASAALMPCLFAQMLLALSSGFYRTPKTQPFHLLYILFRWLAMLMGLIAGVKMYSEAMKPRGLCAH